MTKPKELDEISWGEVNHRFEQNWLIPMKNEMLLDAKLFESQNDYRMAVVTSAIGIESISKEYLIQKMEKNNTSKRNLSKSQINKFVDEIAINKFYQF